VGLRGLIVLVYRVLAQMLVDRVFPFPSSADSRAFCPPTATCQPRSDSSMCSGLRPRYVASY
jgi:hypothetical protein